MSVLVVDVALAKRELRQAVYDLTDRGLYHSAKWAAELMTQIDDRSAAATSGSTDVSTATAIATPLRPAATQSSGGSALFTPAAAAAAPLRTPAVAAASTTTTTSSAAPKSSAKPNAANVKSAKERETKTPAVHTSARTNTGSIARAAAPPQHAAALFTPSTPQVATAAAATNIYQSPAIPSQLEFRTSAAASASGAAPPSVAVVRAVMDDSVCLAKAYFDVREYERAVHTLTTAAAAAGAGAQSAMAVYLRCYSLYLAGEKRKDQDASEKVDTMQRYSVVNPNLKQLHIELSQLYVNYCRHMQLIQQQHGIAAATQAAHSNTAVGGMDAHVLFVYGLVLRDLDVTGTGSGGALAREVLVKSINSYPWNWSAWKTLTSLCTDKPMHESLRLRDHWMKPFFTVDVSLELHQHEIEHIAPLIDALRAYFPASNYLLSQSAIALYNNRDYDEAVILFRELLALDPYRLEDLDIYSNILYVKDMRADLSALAHNATAIDKYRYQTCCIVGNYYSIKQQHEKSALYFRRALKLNPRYLSAWTLMGHEYIEMKNYAAAIEAYRRAVDMNARDFRAWYGLGQVYEIQGMYPHALYYHSKATSLRPFDARMWSALGECYEKSGDSTHAVQCYERAHVNGDKEGVALNKLAKLYERQHESTRAALYYEKIIERANTLAATNSATATAGTAGTGGPNTALLPPDQAEAYQFLVQYYKSTAQWERADECCQRLLDGSTGNSAIAQAKSWLAEIKQLQAAAASAATTQPFSAAKVAAATPAGTGAVSIPGSSARPIAIATPLAATTTAAAISTQRRAQQHVPPP